MTHISYICLRQVNPDADLCADPEVDITKIGRPGPNGPTAPFSEDFYDEEQSIGKEICVLCIVRVFYVYTLHMCNNVQCAFCIEVQRFLVHIKDMHSKSANAFMLNHRKNTCLLTSFSTMTLRESKRKLQCN